MPVFFSIFTPNGRNYRTFVVNEFEIKFYEYQVRSNGETRKRCWLFFTNKNLNKFWIKHLFLQIIDVRFYQFLLVKMTLFYSSRKMRNDLHFVLLLIHKHFSFSWYIFPIVLFLKKLITFYSQSDKIKINSSQFIFYLKLYY